MKNSDAIKAACRSWAENSGYIAFSDMRSDTRERWEANMEKAIAAYLEARGAVLAEAEPVAWRYRDFADGWITSAEKSDLEYATKMGAFLQPLHAALSDNPKGGSDV